ncbi:MAG: galactokinase [Marmoricola sp.]
MNTAAGRDDDAEGTWAAPGRVNLIGEHTDYNEGFVLPIALEHTTRVRLSRRDDGLLRLGSAQEEQPFHGRVDDLAPGNVAGWAAYPAGVVWALRQDGYDVPGFEAGFDSDVPVGAGLSSSAALECSLALALADVLDLGLSRERLARVGQRAENDFVGVPTGGMDQRASLSCTAGHALLLDCRDGAAEQVPFDPAGSGLRLLVVDTRVHHALADGEYGERRTQCEQACRALGVGSLRDASDGDLDRIEDPLLRRRARHVVTENQRVTEVAALLRAGRLVGIGPLLHASHVSMRDDYEISVPELDAVVEAATGAGAVGARMTGGGFGGSAIALVPDVDRVREAVDRRFADEGFGPPAYFEAAPGPGAHRVD